jgi:chorismate mutase/prephenate dehydratase
MSMRYALLVLALSAAVAAPAPGQSDRALASRRARIDALDSRIVALLNERATVVREIGRIKQQAGAPVADPGRVEQVLQRIASRNRGPLPNEHLRRIYQAVIDEMTSFEAAEMSKP